MDGLTGNGSLSADAEVVGGHGAEDARGARRAEVRAQGEPGTEYALRQSLVDLASVSELLADELARPTEP